MLGPVLIGRGVYAVWMGGWTRAYEQAGRRAAWFTGVGLLVGLAGLAGCGPAGDGVPTEGGTSTDSATPIGDTASLTGPVDLASPIEFAIVEETQQPPCAGDHLPGPDGSECFLLGDSLEVTRVEELTMATETNPDGTERDEEVLQLTLTDEDGEAFYDLTGRAVELPEPRIAMVVDGDVISAPTVAEAIPGGAVQIAGWDDAAEFVAEATGTSADG